MLGAFFFFFIVSTLHQWVIRRCLQWASCSSGSASCITDCQETQNLRIAGHTNPIWTLQDIFSSTVRFKSLLKKAQIMGSKKKKRPTNKQKTTKQIQAGREIEPCLFLPRSLVCSCQSQIQLEVQRGQTTEKTATQN
jgi:hypothetical protein